MLDKLNIILVPEVAEFISDNHSADLVFNEHVNGLERILGYKPANIGVISAFFGAKLIGKHKIDEAVKEGLIQKNTNYFPLDLANAALKERDEMANESSLRRNIAYRCLSELSLMEELYLDLQLTPEQRMTWQFLGVVPSFEYLRRINENIGNKIRKYIQVVNDPELYTTFEEIKDITFKLESLFSWKNLEEIKIFYQNRFLEHKVSPNFPLQYIPPRIQMPEYYLLDVKSKCKVSDRHLILNSTGSAREAEKSTGQLIRLVPEIRENSQTRIIGSYESLQHVLTKPLTVMTDVYFLDLVPAIRNSEFNTFEFRP